MYYSLPGKPVARHGNTTDITEEDSNMFLSQRYMHDKPRFRKEQQYAATYGDKHEGLTSMRARRIV
jgi:hypothetical protein